ncbi:MAG: methyltransferase domain-containing protein [Candidatus Omnitrophica bacterium]|nr:methyltransferase domain-containing protein [Candidatus Omnitrophota bacterium]
MTPTPTEKRAAYISGPFSDERLNRHLRKTVGAPAALARAVADLEGYCREPIRAVAERYWTSPMAPADQRPESLLEFYKTSDRYLYESTMTEGYADHQRMAQLVIAAVRRWRLSPILDFGGGGGGLTVALTARGVPCEYADVPGKLTEFVRWRLAQRGVTASIHDATQPLPAARYRAVLAVDVLEHVPDLAATVRQLKAALGPGGWLIATHSFTPDDPLHLASSHQYGDLKVFDAFMQTEGFHYRGRLKACVISEAIYRHTGRSIIWTTRLSRKLKGGGNLLVYVNENI